MIEIRTETDLFGEEYSTGATIDRAMLAAGLYANLKDVSLEEFVSLFVSRIDAIVDYTELYKNANVGQRISLLFNPHRLSTSTKSCAISLYTSLKDERFSKGLSRVMTLKKGRGSRTEGLLYDATAGIGGLNGVSWIQEFPPHVARDLALEHGLTKASKVLDPCAGWGGRMIGFSTIVDSYTCCEPSTRTAAGLRKLHDWLRVFRSDFSATIYEAPFEDVDLMPQSFDFALTSPPYYDTERYADEATNSFNRYATFDAWCDGFYAPLVHRTMAALKPGAAFILNIGSRVYPLNDRLFSIAQGRYGVEKQKGRLSASNGLGKDGEGETFYEVRNPGDAPIIVAPTVIAPLAEKSVVAHMPTCVSVLDFIARTSSVELAQPLTDVSSVSLAVTEKAPAPPAEALLEGPAQSSAPSSAEAAAALKDMLELRGHRLLTRDGKFFVSEAGRLTDEDRASIKEHREQLVALAEAWAEETAPVVQTTLEQTQQVQSIAQFLDPAPASPELNWRAKEPPCLDGIDRVTLNFETTGVRYWIDKPVGVTIGTLDGQLKQYLPFGHRFGGNLDEETVKRWAKRELRNKKIYNHNTKFDIHFSREWGVDLVEQGNQFSDTMHTPALLDETHRLFKLDEMAEHFLGGIKVPRVDESRMADYSAAEVAARAEYQVQLVSELCAVLYPEIERQNLRRVHDLEDATIAPVVECEKNAAHVDRQLLKKYVKESGERLDEYLWKLAREVGAQINPDSNADWQRLFQHCGIPIKAFTAPTKAKPEGSPSFTEDVIRNIDHPLIQLNRRAGKILSLRNMFLLPYDEAVGDDCKLRFSLNQLRGNEHGTVRGRFSMSNKNLQQVFAVGHQRESFGYDEDDASHDDEIFLLRKIFIALKGMYFSADMNQVEFRLAACEAKSKKIIDGYAADPNMDGYLIVKAIIDQIKPITRSRAKVVTLAKIYASGKATTAKTLRMTLAEAEQIIAIYDRALPEMKKLLNDTMEEARRVGYITTLMGRRARFVDERFAHAFLNYKIQGSAADAMKLKMVELHNERKTLGFTMRGSIHDEVVGDCADEESARMIGEVLNRQSFDLPIPLTWSIGTGRSWAHAK